MDAAVCTVSDMRALLLSCYGSFATCATAFSNRCIAFVRQVKMDERAGLLDHAQRPARARPAKPRSPRALEGSAARAGGALKQKQDFDFDKAALDTEAALQREKLHSVLAVEQGAREVRECYDELNNLVAAQQKPLDTVEATSTKPKTKSRVAWASCRRRASSKRRHARRCAASRASSRWLSQL